ncbi:trypsin-like peptidase domain-containing protein [bacterium 210917-SL.2.15]|nr:trypsin-like peptidase domain-containing protein [bacterium 210917-SL.2.15]
MNRNKLSWSEHYADRPVNPQQAALWQAQIQPPAPPVAPSPSQGSGPGIRNPWIDGLPRRARGSRRGLVIFLLLLALLLGVSILYGVLIGPPDYYYAPGGSDSSSLLSDGGMETSIPTISGGSTRLVLTEVHGASLTAGEVFQKVNPAVVSVIAADGSGGASIGTGVLFTSDGFFLTNAHVIDGATSCTALLSDGRQYEARLVGYDYMRDVAVLKAIDAVGLPAAELGDSSTLSVGDKVYAIGNPLGLELRSTLTDGIVSYIDRDVRIGGRTMTLIQTNAALNKGNSGGPLINEYGQVIGINAAKMSAGTGETGVEGLGFAIPTETVAYLANQILEYGHSLADTSLGITVQAIGETGDEVQGVLVVMVNEGSCAEAAGVQPGDVIIAADNQAVTTTGDLLAVRRGHSPGEKMDLTILRGTNTLTLTVVLDAL